MKKKLFLFFALSWFSALTLSAQLSMSVSITSGTAVYSNYGYSTWIDGTVTVRRASTATNPYFTVDLLPRADRIGTYCARNDDWTYHSTDGSITQNFHIDNAEVYVGSNHSTSANILKTWDAAGIGDNNVSSGNVLQGNFSGTSLTRTFNFCAVFWQTSIMDAGFYELPITFRLRQEQFSTSGPTSEPIETSVQVWRFVVSTTAAIYFKSGTNEIFEIAFDEITALTPKNFTVSIQTNFRFYLTVESKNRGKRIHTEYPNEQIPYTLVMQGTTIPLNTSYRFPTRYRSTGFGTSSRDFSSTITLGDISSYTAGRYEDILSFTVTAN